VTGRLHPLQASPGLLFYPYEPDVFPHPNPDVSPGQKPS
jgi:hypothetical protein